MYLEENCRKQLGDFEKKRREMRVYITEKRNHEEETARLLTPAHRVKRKRKSLPSSHREQKKRGGNFGEGVNRAGCPLRSMREKDKGSSPLTTLSHQRKGKDRKALALPCLGG